MARVRFAPSPTGMLHLGGARTALFNYLHAKSLGGSLVLRIEDTDKERFVPGSAKNLQESLEWLGLRCDEGPGVGGNYGPYVQSERLSLYQQHAHRLVKSGNAYPCFCSQERLQSLQFTAVEHSLTKSSGYDGHCRRLSKRQVQEKLQMGSTHTVRLKVPSSGDTSISDVVYGQVQIANSDINDQVLLKSDGTPTYHLASVVDDHCMEISHVLRGEEWLLSTAKHLLLYSFFDWTPPIYAHLPLLMSNSGTKLSKRNKDVFIENYKERGFQPEALVNYMALLGWGPSTLVDQDKAVRQPLTKDDEAFSPEILSMDELAEQFSLEGINRKPALVHEAKLLWMNKHYFKQKLRTENGIKELAVQLQTEVCKYYGLPEEDDLVSVDRIKHILLLVEDRIPFIARVAEEASYFWKTPNVHNELFADSKLSNKAVCLNLVKDTLQSCDFRDLENLNSSLKGAAVKQGVPFKQLMLLTRLALTGIKVSPGLSGVMKVLGKETVLDRLHHSINALT